MVLKTKIITVIALVLLIAISVSTIVVLNVQNRKMAETQKKDIEVLSGIILRGIEDAMAKGKTDEVQQIIENIGKNKELLALRILSGDGYILKSKNSVEIGKKTVDNMKITQTQSSISMIDGNIITHYYPIPNKEQCFGCHSSTAKINGLIEIKYDLTNDMAAIGDIKKLLIMSNIATVVVVAILLSALLTKLIIRPLGGFMDVIKDVENGNWDARVMVKEGDELGIIGKSFNDMLYEIKKLYEKSLKKEKEISKVKTELEHKRKLEELNSHLEYKVKEVETANKAVLSLSKEVKSKNIELEKMIERLKKINEVGRVLTSIIETDELMKLIIRTTAEMLHAEKGFIHFSRAEERRLTLQYKRGLGIEDTTDLSFDFHPIYKEILHEGRTIFIGPKTRSVNLPEGLSTPAIGVPLKLRGEIVGGMLLEEKIDGGSFTAEELELLGTMANQAMVAIENAHLYETVKINYFGTIQSLVNALEANDKYTRGHSERVKALSLELAKYIGLDYKELEILEHAAILHDIGKIGIESVVLNKVGKLSSDEFSIIKAHPLIGDEILGPIGTLSSVRMTILQHHERYDGTGYPYGIAGDEICLKARILTVVDTFDAMLTDRPYRKALPFERTREEIRVNAGSQFDPMVVNAFLEMIDTRGDFLSNMGYNLN